MKRMVTKKEIGEIAVDSVSEAIESGEIVTSSVTCSIQHGTAEYRHDEEYFDLEFTPLAGANNFVFMAGDFSFKENGNTKQLYFNNSMGVMALFEVDISGAFVEAQDWQLNEVMVNEDEFYVYVYPKEGYSVGTITNVAQPIVSVVAFKQE